MANNIPITEGQGQSSVAAEQIGTTKYQQIKVVGGEVGSTSVLGVNPDRSINVSVIGAVTVTGSIIAAGNQSVSGTVMVQGQAAPNASIVGNPVYVGGIDNNGAITPLRMGITDYSGTASALAVGLVARTSGGALNYVTALSDGSDNKNTDGARFLGVYAIPGVFNGTNFDRLRGNSSIGALVSTGASSVIVVGQQGASVSGAVTAPAGSVQAVRTDNASVIVLIQAASIAGTYAEDAASASGDRGLLVMGARNDTLASVTSADGDYSSHVVGPAGELIAENAPLTKWVSGTASMLGGVPLTCSVTVIAAQGASIFTYITGVQVANMGSSSVLVSFGGATSSLIGYTIAPAGGGSNIYYQNGIKTNANGAFSASVSGTASVYVSAQGFISKT